MQSITLTGKNFFIVIMAVLLFNASNAQNKITNELVTISGLILNETNEPLTGVTLSVNNKPVGVTNDEGKFNARLPKGSRLSFTSIGYKSLVGEIA